ncbi:c-type cytochrome [Pararhodospirillum photometricum]|nr:cytochrome c [Pararhodospirillum photometricum]
MKRLLMAAAAAVTVAVTGFGVAHAASPEAYVEYRKQALKASGDHMKALSAIVKGELPLSAEAAKHAEAIAAIMETLPAAFPEGTAGIAKTEAKAVVWSKPDEFKANAQKSADAAKALAQAAASGDTAQMGKALAALGGTCKGCHETFRE